MKKSFVLMLLLVGCSTSNTYTLINGKIDGKTHINEYGVEYKKIETYEKNKLVKIEEVWDAKGNKELLPSTDLGENDEIVFDTFIHYNDKDPMIGLYKLKGKEVLLRCETYEDVVEYTPTSPEWDEVKKSGFKCPKE